MSYVIDRRLNSKNKSAVNRQRFLDRYKKHIQRSVQDAVDGRSITDVERGQEVTIPGSDISEPVFSHGNGGHRSIVHPGNKEFAAGDRFPRQKNGGGGGGDGEASNQGEGDDDFVFNLTREEYLDYLFDGLELPNLTKRQLKGDGAHKYVHAGYTNDGVPAKLSVTRSMKAAKSRRIALTGTPRRAIARAEQELEEAQEAGDELACLRLQEELWSESAIVRGDCSE